MKKSILATLSVIILSSCTSNNIRSYKVDSVEFNDFKSRSTGKIKFDGVKMPKNDKNSIMCRMAGNVYLPNKMTYSQYIDDALRRVLISIDKLAEHDNSEGSSLAIELKEVSFSSLAGEWVIDGNVVISDKSPVYVKSITKYGTSWDAYSACRNAADSFDEAVTAFSKKVLLEIK